MATKARKEPSRIWMPAHDETRLPGKVQLRLLSYNIQVGMRTGHYGHYVSRAWQHVLPAPRMRGNLDRIAELMRGYDFVAVQEADAGSLRTQQLNQMEYLAKRAGFEHFGLAITRNLRPVAQHCLGYLSRLAPAAVREHTLPSWIPGRRAITVSLGAAAGGLTLLVTHLSLTRGAQHQQLEYLSRLLPPTGPAVLLGDLNAEPELLHGHGGLRRRQLGPPPGTPATFPSWQPERRIDHILVSPEVHVHRIHALPHAISDHLPLAAEISVARST